MTVSHSACNAAMYKQRCNCPIGYFGIGVVIRCTSGEALDIKITTSECEDINFLQKKILMKLKYCAFIFRHDYRDIIL